MEYASGHIVTGQSQRDHASQRGCIDHFRISDSGQSGLDRKNPPRNLL